jgi:hypothetical protein
MSDRGFVLTRQAIQRQLAAMPHDLYLVRLIHHSTRRAFPGERLWTAAQLASEAVIRFLRARNCQGCDVYVQPYAGDRNAGYVLVDLDHAAAAVVELMRACGHDPCVVLQTSPGHLQAWVRLSALPLEPAVATAAGKHLADLYGGDRASTDWRHLGRLAGFTNQKPQRRSRAGYAPWVRVVHARVGLAPQAAALLRSVRAMAPPACCIGQETTDTAWAPTSVTALEAHAIYRGCIQRWHIRQRFPQPDWSIVDLWVARHLLSQGTPGTRVHDILQLASPGFPRRHGDPEDYLRRTLARAAFPSAPLHPVCAVHVWASVRPGTVSARSNSAGGR